MANYAPEWWRHGRLCVNGDRVSRGTDSARQRGLGEVKGLYRGAPWPKMDTEPKVWGTNSHKNKRRAGEQRGCHLLPGQHGMSAGSEGMSLG